MKHYEELIEVKSEYHDEIIEYIECVYTYYELEDYEFKIAYYEGEAIIKDEMENG